MSLWEVLKDEEEGMVEAIYSYFEFLSDYSDVTSFVLVEGRDDNEIFKRFLDYDQLCDLIIVNGRRYIEEAFPVPIEYQQRCLGIIDLDFDYVITGKIYPENIVVLETHDLETLILSSPAFTLLLQAYGDSQLIQQFEINQKCTVVNRVLLSGKYIGILRLIDYLRKRNDLPGMNFKNLNYARFIDTTSLKLNVDELIESVKRNTNHEEIQKIDTNSIKAQMEELDGLFRDDWVVCQGHDISEILAIGFRFIFGNRGEYSRNKIQGKLKDADICRPEHIIGRPFHRNLIQWEHDHEPFRILISSLR
ncbi:MAG: hypothetical protein A4E59_01021 [Syntrophorhabdus sp. PtaB.Bin027]|nr:MAG: hypothetical protein A4E59_01021 [Syntrophorhabdus sp. PtaB.Bin027]